MIQIFLSLSLFIFVLSLLIVTLRDRYGYLSIFFSLYFILILIIPAYFHVNNNIFPFYGLSYEYSDQLSASIILLVFTVFFWLSFFLTPNKSLIKRRETNKSLDKFRFMYVIWSVLLILTISLFFYGLNIFLTNRGDSYSGSLSDNSTTRELLLTFLRSGSFFAMFFLLIYKKFVSKLYWYFTFLWAFILFFIFNYPLALSRFLFFSYLILLFCYFVTPSKVSKFSVITIFVFGITTLFPFFSYVTRGEGNFLESLNGYYQNSGDFDGFQSIINAVIYTSNVGYSLGNQISSSLFSFIPRSIWLGKAEPTGSITAAAAGYDFLNISSPLPAEFFVDFSYVGLIFFSTILGIAFKKIDSLVLTSGKQELRFILSIILISLIPILSRGSILAVINIFYAELIICSLLYYLIFLKIKFK
ncbi:O-antigen polymerase [Acinetobacter soli]|uniref:O-antigen polymerase n=1 Tax=Acinetobacter soli TaxID=487316 RepID=UPI0012502D54